MYPSMSHGTGRWSEELQWTVMDLRTNQWSDDLQRLVTDVWTKLVREDGQGAAPPEIVKGTLIRDRRSEQ
jgi:hypothetical protein